MESSRLQMRVFWIACGPASAVFGISHGSHTRIFARRTAESNSGKALRREKSKNGRGLARTTYTRKHIQDQPTGGSSMSIFKRGSMYWYHFLFNGEHVQKSTKQGNP